MVGLANYWPMDNSGVDIVGGLTATSSSPQFAPDRFGRPYASIYVNSSNSGWSLPNRAFFQGDTTFTFWVKKASCSANGWSTYGNLDIIFFQKHTSCNTIFFFISAFFGGSASGGSTIYIYFTTNCADHFQMYNPTGTVYYDFTGLIVTSAGSWYHLAFVYSGTNAYIYSNGTLSASYASMPSSTLTNVTRYDNHLGTDGTGHFANVYLDSIRLYNTALTADQVKIDMNMA
jgi:hypothetical protein